MAALEVRDRPKDLDWVKQTFLVSESDLTKYDVYARIMTDADFKWTDTTVGGHQAINMPYQFTRYADLKTGLAYSGMKELTNKENREINPRYSEGSGGDESLIGDMIYDLKESYSDFGISHAGMFGMGRYYQESIEEHATLVHMRFGVPEYNSVIRFLGYFYNPAKGFLANRGGDLAFSIGNAMGELLGSLFMIPVLPFVLGGRIFRRLADSPSSKYYYLKPTMLLYRQAVSSMLNVIAVNLGISPYSPSDIASGRFDSTTQKNSGQDFTIFHELLPDVIEANGFINFFAVTTRYQRKANYINDGLAAMMNRDTNIWTSAKTLVREYIQLHNDFAAGKGAPPPVTHESYIKKWFGIGSNQANVATPPSTPAEQASSTSIANMYPEEGDDRYDNAGDEAFTPQMPKTNISSVDSLGSFFRAEGQDGGQFVTFRVENPGSMSESFSNSTRESDLAQKLNSISGTVRNAKFNYSTLLSKIPGVDTVISTLEGLVGGFLGQLEIGGLMALSGMSFVDIPKQWESSSANLPRADFTIQLRSVYGNKVSQFFDIYIPLAMIMAGALPLSTGKQSYTSPFICECYCQGRCTIRLGMIESLSITRAVSNLPFNVNKGITGVDVSFSVVDLSSIMHMPLMTGESSLWQKAASNIAGAVGGEGAADKLDTFLAVLSPSTYQEDNPFLDYMATLSSLSVTHMIYGTRKIQLDIAQKRQGLKTWRSTAAIVGELSETFVGKSIRYIARPSERG